MQQCGEDSVKANVLRRSANPEKQNLATISSYRHEHNRRNSSGPVTRGPTWNRTSSSLPALESLKAPAPAKSTAASRDLRMDLIPSICSRHFSWGGSVGIGVLVVFLCSESVHTYVG